MTVFVLDESKAELTSGAIQVTHLQTTEETTDIKSLFTNEQYLQQAERRKITCSIGGARPSKRAPVRGIHFVKILLYNFLYENFDSI